MFIFSLSVQFDPCVQEGVSASSGPGECILLAETGYDYTHAPVRGNYSAGVPAVEVSGLAGGVGAVVLGTVLVCCTIARRIRNQGR